MNNSAGLPPEKPVNDPDDQIVYPGLNVRWRRPKEWVEEPNPDIPDKVGPGDFTLAESDLPPYINFIKIYYCFAAGDYAQIWAQGDESHIFELKGPKGEIELPVTSGHKWTLRLPDKARVGCFILDVR